MKRPLTHKQEKFIEVYLKTSNATEAYRQAYNCENMKPESINRKAKELIDNVKISAIITKVKNKTKKNIEKEFTYSVSQSFKNFEKLQKLAKKDGQYQAALKAEENKAKLFGLYEKDNKQKQDENHIIILPDNKRDE